MKKRYCECGVQIFSRQRTLCIQCSLKKENKDKTVMNKSPYLAAPPAHNFEQVSDEETIWMLSSFIKKREDLGTSGPVMHYRPGDPGFSAMARQYEVAI